MTFDRTRLPDPLTYYGGEGLIFRERKGKWRTTSCFNCASSDAMRVNTDSGAFVCMTGCGARGGDVVAYHQAAHGLGFIDAAKALGAWIDDGKDLNRTRPTPLPARDALSVLGFESTLTAVAASSLARGLTLTDRDRARLMVAAGRINHIAGAFA
ncbi:MAG: hypothetical protein QM586_15350 [Xenophilus sp.]